MSRSLSIQSPAFPDGLFSPVKLSGSETFNDLFEYTLILKTPDSDPTGFLRSLGLRMPAREGINQSDTNENKFTNKPILHIFNWLNHAKCL